MYKLYGSSNYRHISNKGNAKEKKKMLTRGVYYNKGIFKNTYCGFTQRKKNIF